MEIQRYVEDFSNTVGFRADMEHPYVTYENNFIESEWWVFETDLGKRSPMKVIRSFP